MTASSVKPALYRVKDVERILSVSSFEVRRLCNEGVLHRRYIGEGSRFYRITAQSVENYIDSLSPEPAS